MSKHIVGPPELRHAETPQKSQRVTGPIGADAESLRLPPWDAAGEDRCQGGAYLRRFCKLARWPVAARCGHATNCQNHPAVTAQRYKLVAEVPADAEAIGPVRTADARTIVLWHIPQTGEVVGVPE